MTWHTCSMSIFLLTADTRQIMFAVSWSTQLLVTSNYVCAVLVVVEASLESSLMSGDHGIKWCGFCLLHIIISLIRFFFT